MYSFHVEWVQKLNHFFGNRQMETKFRNEYEKQIFSLIDEDLIRILWPGLPWGKKMVNLSVWPKAQEFQIKMPWLKNAAQL